MATVKESRPASSGLSDWLFELAIGAAVLALGLAVWLYTHFSQAPDTIQKARPVWLGLPKVMAQMADGRMVNLKLNLQLDHDDAIDELDEHVPAFQTLIQGLATQTPREEMQSREGMLRFSAGIGASLNDYLDAQQAQGRIQNVVFEEFTLLP